MSSPNPSPAARPWWFRPLAGVGLIVAAVVLAWSNSLTGPFVLDDHSSIVDNPTIRHLWPPDWLRPPATAGETVSGRPVLNFTFAVNHAVGGLEVRGYHVANLLIHVAAALVLWGLLRRTPAVGEGGIALVATLLWALHPLDTAAVTYVVQRAESLAGLFALLTLYGFVRGAQGGGTRWFVAAVLAGLLGVGTKETVAVVPVLALLYDRAFLAGSFRAAWQLRGRVHAALLATWLPLAVLVWTNAGRGGSVGTAVIGTGAYFLTQCAAMVRYLGLVFWPVGQVFDYGTPVMTDLGAVLPQFLLLAGLAGAALWLLVRNRPAGSAGAAFFLLLAPSSSFVPVATQTIAEHRMYLALAALAALVCAAAGARLPRRLAVGLAVVAIVALGAATFARNRVYQSTLSLWTDTVAARPDNPRAHYNLGFALAAAGRTGEAAEEFERTLMLQPNHAFAHFELGKAALLAGRWAGAADRFAAAVHADPRFVDARVNLGQALTQLGRGEEAIAQYREALTLEPAAPDIRVNLAGALIQQGQVGEGTAMLREVLATSPDLPGAHFHLGLALVKSRDPVAAEEEFRTALRLQPDFTAAQRALGQALASRGDLAGAETAFRETLRLDGGSAATWFALGNLLARQQRFPEAIAAYQAALAREPAHLDARSNLANSLLFTGRLDEAIANYEAVLQARPNDARTRENLRLAREARAERR